MRYGAEQEQPQTITTSRAYLYNAITWSASGQFAFNNNNFNLVNNGTDQNCANGSSGFWNKENNGETATPTCTGNTFSNAVTGTTASVAPTLSPASGTFSGSQVVTIANPGTNRDTNTTDWCTTDGSTPTPGAGHGCWLLQRRDAHRHQHDHGEVRGHVGCT